MDIEEEKEVNLDQMILELTKSEQAITALSKYFLAQAEISSTREH